MSRLPKISKTLSQNVQRERHWCHCVICGIEGWNFENAMLITYQIRINASSVLLVNHKVWGRLVFMCATGTTNVREGTLPLILCHRAAVFM